MQMANVNEKWQVHGVNFLCKQPMERQFAVCCSTFAICPNQTLVSILKCFSCFIDRLSREGQIFVQSQTHS